MRDPKELELEQGDDELIRSVVRELRKPVRLDPALDARVMAEVLASAAPSKSAGSPRLEVARPKRPGIWSWLVQPKSVRISPLAGLAMAAAFAGVMVMQQGRGARGEGREIVGASAPVADSPSTVVPVGNPGAQQYMHFVFVSPDAKSVSLVGDFNDWDASKTPLAASRSGGVWSVVVPLPPGRYTYTFVVDGTKWVADPSAPPALEDDFGTPKSVVTVGGSHT